MVRVHKKRMHSISKEIYECDICNKITSSKRSLRSHKITHSEKKFKCEICDKMFRRQLNLKVYAELNCYISKYSNSWLLLGTFSYTFRRTSLYLSILSSNVQKSNQFVRAQEKSSPQRVVRGKAENV